MGRIGRGFVSNRRHALVFVLLTMARVFDLPGSRKLGSVDPLSTGGRNRGSKMRGDV